MHGCYIELVALLEQLGYRGGGMREAPEDRRAIFLGDLVDRGPDSLGILRLVMHMVESGPALCVPATMTSSCSASSTAATYA